MAFKISRKPTFSATVEVFTPNDKCGHDRSSFTARFSQTSRSELDRLRSLPQIDVLREKLTGWSDLQDDSGADVPFDSENVEALLEIPEAVYGLSLAFWNCVVKAREKN